MTPQEREALIRVRDKLAFGALKLNMQMIRSSCGTAHCIGGWMYVFLKPSEVGYHDIWSYVQQGGCTRSQKLKSLFYPQTLNRKWGNITPAQAVRAIDNFLKDGFPRWRKVVKS